MMNSRSARSVWNRNRRAGFTLIEVIVVFFVLALLATLLLPSVGRGREAARRTQCKNNFKQIGLALHNYHDAFGCFPMAHTINLEHKPLHSWRSSVLPYVDHPTLFNQIDWNQAWDAPANTSAFEKNMLSVYHCPSDPFLSAGQTTYLAPVSAHSCLQPALSRTLSQITDGTSNTMAVSEVASADAARWMAPHDATEPLLLGYDAKTKTAHTGGRHALLADGSVRFLSNSLNPETLKALISVNCGDQVGDF